MTVLRTAAQQALEALDAATSYIDGYYVPRGKTTLPEIEEAQKALRAALAKDEPVEPVAWLAPDGSVRETTAAKSFGEWVWGPDDFRPLYTAPPQRKPLTEEEIVDAVREADLDWQKGWTLDETQSNRFVTLARAVERAHGIT